MSTAEDKDLIESIVDHLYDEQPETVAELPDAEVERRARFALRRARAHGLTTDAAAIAFVSLMFLAGPGFDSHPKIKEALRANTLPPDERMKTLFERTKESDWDEAEQLPGLWEEIN